MNVNIIEEEMNMKIIEQNMLMLRQEDQSVVDEKVLKVTAILMVMVSMQDLNIETDQNMVMVRGIQMRIEIDVNFLEQEQTKHHQDQELVVDMNVIKAEQRNMKQLCLIAPLTSYSKLLRKISTSIHKLQG